MELDDREVARIISVQLSEFCHFDGAERPPDPEPQSFQFKKFHCIDRYPDESDEDLAVAEVMKIRPSGRCQDFNDIRTFIKFRGEEIIQQTIGVVIYPDMVFVANVADLEVMSESDSWKGYMHSIKEWHPATKTKKYKISGRYREFEIPSALWGVRLTPSFVCPSGSAFLLSRPGGNEAPFGIPNFSSVLLFRHGTKRAAVLATPTASRRLAVGAA